MFTVSTEIHFAAAHKLRHYCGACENLHGHNWKVRATAEATELDAISLAIDFKILKKHLKTILNELDHSYLNEIFTEEKGNPTSENIARYIFHKIAPLIQQENSTARISRIDVWETPGNCASYYEN